MSWRRTSRLCASTAAVAADDVDGLRRLIQDERRLASEEAANVAQQLSSAALRLRDHRALAVRHAACLVVAMRSTLPLRAAAEQQRRQVLLQLATSASAPISASFGAQLCQEEDELSEVRRREEAVLLTDWRRRLAQGDAGRLQVVQAEQAARLQELADEQARLEREVYTECAPLVCSEDGEVPVDVPATWQWLILLDQNTQDEVRDNCAVVDCAYVKRLAGVWARHGFCGGTHDFHLTQLAGYLAAVQYSPDDTLVCWAHVERVYPPATAGRQQLLMDMMSRLWPMLTQRALVAARARRRHWSAALAAHTAAVHDWRLQKDVLGRELEAQVLGWLRSQAERQEAAAERELTQRRGAALRERVTAWRKRTLDVARQADQAATVRQAEQRAQAEAAMVRETARRGADRERLVVYQERQRDRERQLLQLNEQRRQERERRGAAEAAHRQRRITVRQELRGQRLRQQQERQQAVVAQEAQRERRLAAIRAQVQVEADRNVSRLQAETQASWTRRGDALTHDTTPADAANRSFWDSQLAGDRRVRLESRLREAGLLDSAYARDMLQTLSGEARPHLRPAHCWKGEGDQ